MRGDGAPGAGARHRAGGVHSANGEDENKRSETTAGVAFLMTMAKRTGVDGERALLELTCLCPSGGVGLWTVWRPGSRGGRASERPRVHLARRVTTLTEIVICVIV